MSVLTQGSLVLVGMNTESPQVFWNGALVEGITGISVTNEGEKHQVILKTAEVPNFAEMISNGITIKRTV